MSSFFPSHYANEIYHWLSEPVLAEPAMQIIVVKQPYPLLSTIISQISLTTSQRTLTTPSE